MIVQLLQTIGYLALLTAIGFVLFRHPWMQRRALPVYLTLILKVLFPIYFIVRIPLGWEAAVVLGWPMLLALFLLCLGMMLLQGALAQRVAAQGWSRVSQRSSYVLIAAVHNAGFVPLPILERLVPEGVMLGMFFYLLAFNISFWAVAVPIIQSGRIGVSREAFRLNAPLVGMGIGFLLALTGWHRLFPAELFRTLGQVGEVSLDGALIALGGALASIRERMQLSREHGIFLAWRMVLYPLVMLLTVALPWPGLGGPLGWGLRTMLVLEAASPPATQTLVVTRAMGSSRQLHYTGGLVLLSYLTSLVTIPLFVAGAVAWFS